MRPALGALVLLFGLLPSAHADVVGNGAQAEVFYWAGPAYRAVGPFEDSAVDPGFSHEPNHPGDRYPGAWLGAGCDGSEAMAGACNDYAGYRTLRAGTERFLFADLKPYRVVYAPNPLAAWPFEGIEALHPWGSTSTQEPGPAALGLDPYRGRALAPGAYQFATPVGGWLDLDHLVNETVLAPLGPLHECFVPSGLAGSVTCSYRTGFDGWVGNVVELTEAYRYRGHHPQTCRVGNLVATYEHALCHPHKEGWKSDPNAYVGEGSAGEFEPDCGLVDTSKPWLTAVRLTPVDGAWRTPVFVWQDFWTGFPPGLHHATSNLRDYTGTTVDIWLKTRCSNGWLATTDLLLLPTGNLDTPLRTTVVLPHRRGAYELTDVDAYVEW